MYSPARTPALSSFGEIRKRPGFNLLYLVRMKGLEPPHPCGYMDLNHARLPIPPHPHSRLKNKHPPPYGCGQVLLHHVNAHAARRAFH